MYEKGATRVQRLVGRQEMMADWPPGGRGSVPFAHVQCGPDSLENVTLLRGKELGGVVYKVRILAAFAFIGPTDSAKLIRRGSLSVRCLLPAVQPASSSQSFPIRGAG